jgi:hypothetical protein
MFYSQERRAFLASYEGISYNNTIRVLNKDLLMLKV